MISETVADQLQRAHDLFDEGISIIEDVRATLGPVWWPETAIRHARLAREDLRQRLT